MTSQPPISEVLVPFGILKVEEAVGKTLVVIMPLIRELLKPETLFLLIPITAIICAYGVKAVKLIIDRSAAGKKHLRLCSEDANTLLRMTALLDRMETRIEALETILMERSSGTVHSSLNRHE